VHSFRVNGRDVLGIEVNVGKKISELLQEERGRTVWSTVDLDKKLGRIAAGQNIIANLKKQKFNKEKKLHYGSLVIPSDALVETILPRRGWAISVEWGEKIVEEAHKSVSKSENVLSSSEFADLLDVSTTTVKNIIKKIKMGTFNQDVPKSAIVMYDNPRTKLPSLGVSSEWAEIISKTYNRHQNSGETLKSKPITPRKSPAHMTEEERKEKKRGGKGIDD